VYETTNNNGQIPPWVL